MTQPILGQRSRGELITELYDRHAAGLFAYCHDQLGDPDAAAAALLAVFADIPAAEPPRAALYALARREIHRRDVVYAPPTAGSDPISGFIERVLRDLRPHQREVLYLSGVCEMDTSELSWVLDVAADTADELTVSALRRFAQSLEPALASVRVPVDLADAFGALGVAPIRDVLVRAPWAVPPAALRVTVLGAQAGTAPASRLPSPQATPPTASSAAPSAAPRPAPAPLKPLWPTSPAWPLPLGETDALTNTSLFSPPDLPPPFSPAGFFPSSTQDRFPDPFSAPDPDVLSVHEATTEPIPKLRDSVLSALDDVVPRSPRRKLQRPKPRRAKPLSAPVPGEVLDGTSQAPPARAGDDSPIEDLFQPFTPEPRATRPHTDKLVASAPREETAEADAPLPGWPLRAEELDAAVPVWEPTAAPPALPDWPLRADELEAAAPSRARHAKRPEAERTPDAPLPFDLPADPPAVDSPPIGLPVKPADSPADIVGLPVEDGTAEPSPPGTAHATVTPAARSSRMSGRARRRHRPVRQREQHHDWAWELFGFIICVICVAIAMLVFFAVPTMVTP